MIVGLLKANNDLIGQANGFFPTIIDQSIYKFYVIDLNRKRPFLFIGGHDA